ncbi:MAG: hypothetical protein KBD90_04705 [Alphaproteobacteria bacterium]|jgi:hypothetical protein|nr:hypothetical protein [Alphaproteobacteria bacterium]
MTIRDENNLLSEEERQSYHRLLKTHGHEPHHFFLEVLEDQTPMDMNDMSYIVIIKTKATHLKHEKSKTYVSRAESGTWLSEFEEDLKKGYFLRG